jgi:serine/threonine protein kinase
VKVDIWALGLIFYLLIDGNFPFELNKCMRDKMLINEGLRGYYNHLKEKRFLNRDQINLRQQNKFRYYKDEIRDLLFQML